MFFNKYTLKLEKIILENINEDRNNERFIA